MSVRYNQRKKSIRLDEKIETSMDGRYASAIRKVKIPPEGLIKSERRRQVAEQLKKLGVENEYVAYAIASRIIKK